MESPRSRGQAEYLSSSGKQGGYNVNRLILFSAHLVVLVIVRHGDVAAAVGGGVHVPGEGFCVLGGRVSINHHRSLRAQT